MATPDSYGPTIIQVIWTRWTEASRGAPGAVARNAAPEAATLPLDIQTPDAGRMLWHEVIQDEIAQFRPRGTLRQCPIGRRNFGAAEVIVEPTGLVIERHGIRRLVVPPRAVGRLVFNYFEQKADDGWYRRLYSKVTINAATGLPTTPDLFERPPPSHEARCLTDLEGHDA